MDSIIKFYMMLSDAVKFFTNPKQTIEKRGNAQRFPEFIMEHPLQSLLLTGTVFFNLHRT